MILYNNELILINDLNFNFKYIFRSIDNDDFELNKERWERLNANQALLQRQQDELRALGVIP